MTRFEPVQSMMPFLFFLFIVTTSIAQKKPEVAPQPAMGVDPFPVYEATQGDYYIDSIVYTPKFLIFCISVDKVIDDNSFQIVPVDDPKSCLAHNGTGYRRPLAIREVQMNGKLLASYVKDEPLEISLEPAEGSSKAHLSYQMQFGRSSFSHSQAEIIAVTEKNEVKDYKFSLFKNIRLRTKNYHHAPSTALVQRYERYYDWTDKKLLKATYIEVNEEQFTPSWKTIPSTSTTEQYQPVTYKVIKKNENKLFLEGIKHTNKETILKIANYSAIGADISLYNTKREGFFVKIGNKKIPANNIHNIQMNGLLIKEELKKNETIKFRNIRTSCVITFEVHTERLPDDLLTFDLIEAFKGRYSTPFSFYEVEMVKKEE
ncbi:MAG: hypothetical protein AB8E82_20320 [Aureispira sp.]